MTNFDQEKYEKVVIQEINHLSEQDQAKVLSDHFSKIPNEYSELKTEDIATSPIQETIFHSLIQFKFGGFSQD